MNVIIKETGERIYVGQRDNLAAALNSLGLEYSQVTLQLEPHEAAALAGDYIERDYPQHKQLNLLRAGTAEEIARMGAFIDAVRAWSNGPAPDPSALEAIQP